jgi:hypothetical protein
MLFRSEEHVARWCAERRIPSGATVPLDQMWRMTRPWYGDRLDEYWQPKTPDVIERLLSEAGLTGEFWRMTPNY